MQRAEETSEHDIKKTGLPAIGLVKISKYRKIKEKEFKKNFVSTQGVGQMDEGGMGVCRH